MNTLRRIKELTALVVVSNETSGGKACGATNAVQHSSLQEYCQIRLLVRNYIAAYAARKDAIDDYSQ